MCRTVLRRSQSEEVFELGKGGEKRTTGVVFLEVNGMEKTPWRMYDRYKITDLKQLQALRKKKNPTF